MADFFKITGDAQVCAAESYGRRSHCVRNAKDDKEPAPKTTKNKHNTTAVHSLASAAREFHESP
jgi:hypothetical protein